MEEADFSGWATKNDLVCSDGRVILKDAFAHQDKQKVPLVWQHQHDSVMNVLGHAYLENRAFGVYSYGFFNETPQGEHAKTLLQHGDIKSLSIFANGLKQAGANVKHGTIRELSLVLAGANPGAFIENVAMAHADGEEVVIEANIYTGLSLEHEQMGDPDNMADKIEHDAVTIDKDTDIGAVLDTMTPEQLAVNEFLVEEALKKTGSAEHSAMSEEDILAHVNTGLKEGFDNIMTHRIFEQENEVLNASATQGRKLTHGEVQGIFKEAKKSGQTLKSAFTDFVMAHGEDLGLAHAGGLADGYGIENIDYLFPDAKTLEQNPQFIKRQTEWVAEVISGTNHSPFTRVKSVLMDVTADEARAKGYITGNLKKDEVVKLLKRVTTPKTIYKKQKLDRDDILDITSLDIVAFLKAEMRMMLEEEIARAILVGDGREADDEDKIDEAHIRPIATDDDLYAHHTVVPYGVDGDTLVEHVIRSTINYRGSGSPVFFTSNKVYVDMFLARNKIGQRSYQTKADLEAVLGVTKIVQVEIFNDYPSILGIMVNLRDYTIGTDAGGQISMFDDFDIDYNQFKYLIETRISGALTKPKSALVFTQAPGTEAVPDNPTYNSSTKVLTIPNDTGVQYRINGQVVNAGNRTLTETTTVEAFPQQGYYFPANAVKTWTYTYTA